MMRASALLVALLCFQYTSGAVQKCTVKLLGGLDPVAGFSDVTLSHNCMKGYATTNKVSGTLVDFYRSKNKKCMFGSDPLLVGGQKWCVSMQDGGGFNIASLLQIQGNNGDPLNGFSTRAECHPSSLINFECDFNIGVSPPGSDGGQAVLTVFV